MYPRWFSSNSVCHNFLQIWLIFTTQTSSLSMLENYDKVRTVPKNKNLGVPKVGGWGWKFRKCKHRFEFSVFGHLHSDDMGAFKYVTTTIYQNWCFHNLWPQSDHRFRLPDPNYPRVDWVPTISGQQFVSTKLDVF